MSNSYLSSQGDLRRHRQDLRVLDPRPVEGDELHQVSLPGVQRVPRQEPPARTDPEAGGQAVLEQQHVVPHTTLY
jgi:hypothetical protein